MGPKMTKSQDKNSALKAYTVNGGDTWGAVVVFATSEKKARRIGGKQIKLEDYEVYSCDRSPEFDGYADAGSVPPLVLYANGWQLECGHCYKIIDPHEDHATASDGNYLYCCDEHLAADIAAQG